MLKNKQTTLNLLQNERIIRHMDLKYPTKFIECKSVPTQLHIYLHALAQAPRRRELPAL